MRKLNYFVGLILVVTAITISGQTTASTSIPGASAGTIPVTDDLYRIGYQDILDVQVYRHPELSQRVPVYPNGTISLFRLDRPLTAVCKTDLELATEIAQAYEENLLQRAQVKVVVAEQRSQSIGIIGAIEKPGNHYVNRRVHLLEMLAAAGGPTRDSGTRLIVFSTGNSGTCKQPQVADDGGQITLRDFKIRDVQEGKVTYMMKPGDVISVLDADIIYVYGNVNKQGPVKVREPITLTQAIVSAEGLKPATKKDKIRILRQRSGSPDRDEMIFDLGQIDKGKVKDPVLEPNDIVAVSEDKTKAILLGVGNAFKSAVPNVLYRIP